MATLASVQINQSAITSGQPVSGAVVVTNPAGSANPVIVSNVYLYPSSSVAASMPALSGGAGMLYGPGGGGAGGVGPITYPMVVNVGTSVVFPFNTTAFGAQVPGASVVNVTLSATVIMSDGTVVAASGAVLTIMPLMTTSSQNGVLTPVMAASPQFSLQFYSNLNSMYLPVVSGL